MKLNFSINNYKIQALVSSRIANAYNFNHSKEEVFLLLIKDLEFESLNNFCKYLKEKYNSILSEYDYYQMIQNSIIPEDIKNDLINSAYECLENYGFLGSKTILDGKINTSGWISHSLYEAKLASILATNLGLNNDIAFQMGLLHDIGRKQTHGFDHIIKGFEYLSSIGWNEEAICCLTHSFLCEFTSKSKKCGRFANCDPAEDGFFVSKTLVPYFSEDYKEDDVSEFLNNYNYSLYDIILNISDLMATDKGVVSPYERVQDISTRKVPDERNRAYFLSNFINSLLFYLEVCNDFKTSNNYITNDIEKLNQNFKVVSDLFYAYYESLIIENKKIKF